MRALSIKRKWKEKIFMRKIIALLLPALLAACMFAGCASTSGSDLKYVQDKGTLIVGITDYAPMDYKDENGEWTGFDAEFARLFAKELDVDVEFFVLSDWGKKFYELQTNNIDCIWNGMTITDEVKLNTSVSDPYVKNAQVVVMKSDKIGDYGDFDTMKDLTFAAESGSAGAALINDKSYNCVEVSDQAAALLEVNSGSADACVIDITMANAMTGEGTSYANLGIACELNAEEYGIGFRQDSDMTEKVNGIIKDLLADGTLDGLAEKYSLTLVK